MSIKVGINGFGRIGRLALRAAWDSDAFEITHINEIAGDAKSAAHLLRFDSVHGTWDREISANQANDQIIIDGKAIHYSSNKAIEEGPWAAVDLVVECTGTFKSKQVLSPYFDHGVSKVVVSAPIKDGTLNIVMGVNDHLYQGHNIVTAASCTTNCLAPVIDV
jgi:glyceraldehyde 3-phosphate dehydrogenase